MTRSRIDHLIAFFLLLLSAPPTFADEPATDANLVTALDVSDSIMRHEEWLELQGLATAVTSAAFLDAIAGGTYGRIGFTVFTWSSGGRRTSLVPWTVIETTEDARRVATLLRRVPQIDRSAWARDGNGSGLSAAAEHRTDISAAIDFALGLIAAAPYRSRRSVINVCANGKDNVGSGPRAARDRALAAGIVINALAIAPRKHIAAYFDRQVRGGPGSFVIEVSAPEHVAAAMLDKLLRDLIAAGPQAHLAAPAT
jgi:hypothetical protein